MSTVQTDTVGVVTVTATGFGDSNIDGKKITLTPYNSTTLMGATDIGSQVFRWVCDGDATTPIPANFRPGSCRG